MSFQLPSAGEPLLPTTSVSRADWVSYSGVQLLVYRGAVSQGGA